MESSATLVLERNDDADIKMRGLEVFIDDEFVVNLNYGKRFETSVPEGDHEVRVTNSLYTERLTVHAHAGEEIVLQTGNLMPKGAGFLFALGMGPYRCFLRRAS